MYFEILLNESNHDESEVILRLGTEEATKTYSHGSKLFEFDEQIELKDIAKLRIPGEPARGWQISHPSADGGWCVGRAWGKYVGARVRCWESEAEYRRNHDDYSRMSELIMSNPIWINRRDTPTEQELNRTEVESKKFILKIVDAINQFLVPDDYIEIDDIYI